MDEHVTAELAAPIGTCHAELRDLGGYPDWFEAIASTESAPPADGDPGGPAWFVTLRARVGPFARSKRLRMVRTADAADGDTATVRFERHEDDGRDHSPWRLDVVLSAAGPDRTTATVGLHYGGRLWAPPLDAVLRHQIGAAIPALSERLRDRPADDRA